MTYTLLIIWLGYNHWFDAFEFHYPTKKACLEAKARIDKQPSEDERIAVCLKVLKEKK